MALWLSWLKGLSCNQEILLGLNPSRAFWEEYFKDDSQCKCENIMLTVTVVVFCSLKLCHVCFFNYFFDMNSFTACS